MAWKNASHNSSPDLEKRRPRRRQKNLSALSTKQRIMQGSVAQKWVNVMAARVQTKPYGDPAMRIAMTKPLFAWECLESSSFSGVATSGEEVRALVPGRKAVECVNGRLKLFSWGGADDGNVAGSRRFFALLGVILEAVIRACHQTGSCRPCAGPCRPQGPGLPPVAQLAPQNQRRFCDRPLVVHAAFARVVGEGASLGGSVGSNEAAAIAIATPTPNGSRAPPRASQPARFFQASDCEGTVTRLFSSTKRMRG